MLVWIVVKIARILGTPNEPPTLRVFPDDGGPNDAPRGGLAGAIWDAVAMPTIWKHRPLLWVFLLVFHIAALLLFLAHLDLLPQINIMSARSPHMIGNGAIGVVITICLFYFLFRRFRSPVREVTVPADYLLLILLLGIVLSGDIISWGNSWSDDGFVMTKQDFGAYLDSLVKFTFADPREFLTGGHYAVVGTHVLLANLFLIMLPFSKIMHGFFAVTLNKMRRG